MNIRTRHGDTVDGLLWQHLGRNDEEVTDAFWRLNRHAASHGPIFLSGILLQLPTLTTQATEQRVSPWD